MPAGLWRLAGNGNARFTAEIASGDGLGVLEHFVVGAGEEEFAAEFAGAGAKVDDAIGGLNGVRIVLDYEDGVAEVAEGFEDIDQALGVARVQADGRLVENVQRADEMRAERSGQLDALRFAAGERGGEAIEGEVVEADFIEKLQAACGFLRGFYRRLWLCDSVS